MFKKFTFEDISAQNQLKASVQRKIRQSIVDEYPGLEPLMDDLLPKKSPLIVAKCQNHVNLCCGEQRPIIFQYSGWPLHANTEAASSISEYYEKSYKWTEVL
ncbi:hypothetical protein HPP92_017640 [Vanilla planifolia]|uniref:Pre-PUA domain-containing protein n=1 Tax=Vanilla planifolia TaxID=51239 RepID=A0A835QIE4_VANPL|nr:hypothetical protein HPP92_017640 [Vanilla planifolia]